ncbi:serine/threonine protein kinase [Myxococcota bacterium]|nr:serine/threonine protein kinase [Myxococcota bacterium]
MLSPPFHTHTLTERYELLDEIGQGGMATVYRGRDRLLQRDVAIKILHPHLARDRAHRERFRREAQAIARLRHPGIVEVFDFSGDTASNLAPSAENKDSKDLKDSKGNKETFSTAPAFLVMEYIRGRTLQQFLEEQELPLCEIGVALLATLLPALEHAHAQQIIHRDLKPENVMLQEDGEIKLTDFGLARVMDGESMTRTGTVLGSPAYMAPEQVDGMLGDHRADIFALGVILYRLVCQKHPFLRGRSSPAAILQAVTLCEFPEPEMLKPAMGRELSAILHKAMARDPSDRYESIAKMREDITRYLEGSGISDPQRLIRDYFCAPREAALRLQEQIEAHLKSRIGSLRSQGRIAAALDLCNRLLGLRPGDPDILQVVRSLSAHTSYPRSAWLWTTAAILLLSCAGGTWFWWTSIRTSPLQHRVLVSPSALSLSTRPALSPSALSLSTRPALSPRPTLLPRPTEPSRVRVISPQPPPSLPPTLLHLTADHRKQIQRTKSKRTLRRTRLVASSGLTTQPPAVLPIYPSVRIRLIFRPWADAVELLDETGQPLVPHQGQQAAFVFQVPSAPDDGRLIEIRALGGQGKLAYRGYLRIPLRGSVRHSTRAKRGIWRDLRTVRYFGEAALPTLWGRLTTSDARRLGPKLRLLAATAHSLQVRQANQAKPAATPPRSLRVWVLPWAKHIGIYNLDGDPVVPPQGGGRKYIFSVPSAPNQGVILLLKVDGLQAVQSFQTYLRVPATGMIWQSTQKDRGWRPLPFQKLSEEPEMPTFRTRLPWKAAQLRLVCLDCQQHTTSLSVDGELWGEFQKAVETGTYVFKIPITEERSSQRIAQIEVRRDGYVPWQRQITFQAGAAFPTPSSPPLLVRLQKRP